MTEALKRILPVLHVSPEEKQRQMQAAVQEELNKLAIETLGDKGPALVQNSAL